MFNIKILSAGLTYLYDYYYLTVGWACAIREGRFWLMIPVFFLSVFSIFDSHQPAIPLHRTGVLGAFCAKDPKNIIFSLKQVHISFLAKPTIYTYVLGYYCANGSSTSWLHFHAKPLVTLRPIWQLPHLGGPPACKSKMPCLAAAEGGWVQVRAWGLSWLILTSWWWWCGWGRRKKAFTWRGRKRGGDDQGDGLSLPHIRGGAARWR